MKSLAIKVNNALQENKQMLTTAESCTGGWVAKLITDIAGSSASFERGFVTYTNTAKQDMLGVSANTLATHGAVSEAVAEEMAIGAIQHSLADIAVSISGIAGPSGGTKDKPVGTVCFAWKKRNSPVSSTTQHFTGDRDAVRQQAVIFALQGLLNRL